MLHKIRERAQSEKGFTLIELLVVILIIGILAAIALPAFLGQRLKGQDADAKSNARNLVSHMESCFTAEQDYTNCLASDDVQDSGLPLGGAAGEVDVTAAGTDSYTIVATSKGVSNGNNHTFTITKTAGKLDKPYVCTEVGKGGCDANGNW
jgi:type IV pilus assembly protein PilA